MKYQMANSRGVWPLTFSRKINHAYGINYSKGTQAWKAIILPYAVARSSDHRGVWIDN